MRSQERRCNARENPRVFSVSAVSQRSGNPGVFPSLSFRLVSTLRGFRHSLFRLSTMWRTRILSALSPRSGHPRVLFLSSFNAPGRCSFPLSVSFQRSGLPLLSLSALFQRSKEPRVLLSDFSQCSNLSLFSLSTSVQRSGKPAFLLSNFSQRSGLFCYRFQLCLNARAVLCSLFLTCLNAPENPRVLPFCFVSTLGRFLCFPFLLCLNARGNPASLQAAGPVRRRKPQFTCGVKRLSTVQAPCPYSVSCADRLAWKTNVSGKPCKPRARTVCPAQTGAGVRSA